MTCATTLTLYLVPAHGWAECEDPVADISPFVKDALSIERRILKGTALNNLGNERKRYQLCCSRIQEAVYRQGDAFTHETLGEEYFDLLHRFSALDPAAVARGRIAACFFPPDTIASQIDALTELAGRTGLAGHATVAARLAFLGAARQQGAGIVEVPDYLVRLESGADRPRPIPAEPPSGPFATPEEDWTPKRILDLSGVLRARIEKALASGCEVNFSNQPHFVIADLLNEFSYKRTPGEREGVIRVVYRDGSEAEPFPLRCLTPAPETAHVSGLPVVRASLISMRHLEMDERVDLCWFRSRKVSSLASYREADAYCTAETESLLAGHREPLELHLYQTGLEVAVVGFYRGLVREMLRRRESGVPVPLRVVPHFFNGRSGDYIRGRIWD